MIQKKHRLRKRLRKRNRHQKDVPKETSSSQEASKEESSSKGCDNPLNKNSERKVEVKQEEQRQMMDNDGFEEVLSRRARKLKRQQQCIEQNIRRRTTNGV
jgi:Mg-chelatase subunit ChlI